jgi:hypothetical protein
VKCASLAFDFFRVDVELISAVIIGLSKKFQATAKQFNNAKDVSCLPDIGSRKLMFRLYVRLIIQFSSFSLSRIRKPWKVQ